MRTLQVMVESTQRLSDAIKQTQSAVPWSSIAGFRNVLVHEYLGVDINLVWTVVARDLPPLKAAVQAMLDAV